MDTEQVPAEHVETLPSKHNIPHGQPHPEHLAEVAESVAPTDTSDKYILDGKEFNNEREAFEYMKNKNATVEQELRLTQARLDGIQEAAALLPQGMQGVQTAAPEPEDDTEIWADPKGYIQRQLAREREAMRKEYEMDKHTTQVWNEFSQRYPELARYQGEVEGIANQHAKEIALLAKKDKWSAYDYLANKVKSRWAEQYEAVKPRTELPNHGAGPSIGNTTVTKSTKNTESEKPMDFAAQLRSMRAR